MLSSFLSFISCSPPLEIFVPSSLLNELTEFRCDHTNIEIGSINEILRATCAHLARERQRNRTERSRMVAPLWAQPRYSSKISEVHTFAEVVSQRKAIPGDCVNLGVICRRGR